MTPEELEALAQQAAQIPSQETGLDLESLAQQAAEQNSSTVDDPADPTDDAPETPPPFRQFTTDIYDNAESYEEAVRTYRDFMESPYTTRPLFGLGYAYQTNPETGKRTYINAPSPTFFGDGAKSSFLDLAATGSASAVGNALELGAAASDYLFGTDLTEAAGDLLPDTNTGESGMDALIAEGVPVLASSLIGTGLAMQATQGANWLARGAATTLGGEVGAALASNNDAGSIMIGDNAMLPILRGVDLEDGAANDVIEDRLNLLLDGMLAGGILQGGIEGIRQGTRFVYGMALEPLVNVALRGDAGIEDTAINTVLQQLVDETTGLSPADLADPNVRFEAAQRIAELINANRTVLVPYLNRLEQDLEVNLDSMSSLIRGLGDEAGDPRLIARAEGLRAGRLQNSPLVLDRVNQPGSTLEEQTREYLERVGGSTPAEQTETMGAAAEELAGMGRREVEEAAESAAQARSAYEQSASEVLQDLANDVELSDEIRRLAEVTGTQIDTTANASLEEIREQVTSAYAIMRAEKNSLYAALDGGPVDVGALYDAMSNVAIDELSAQSRTLQRTSPLREIAELLQPRMVVDETPSDSLELTIDAVPGQQGMRQETREEVIERVEAWFARDPETYNFGFFQRVIRPELNQLAEGFFSNNQPLAGNTVRSIIRAIDEDMVDFVAETSPELADAAIAARTYYREEFAPLFRDGRLADIASLYDRTIGRAADIGPIDYRSGSRQILSETIQAGDPDLVRQFRDLLARSEAGANPEPLAEYMVATTIANAAESLRASGGTDVQLGGFINQLRQYSEAMNQLFPERAEELNAFIARVEQAQNNRADLQRIMEEAEQGLSATIDQVRNSELRSFFRQDFGGTLDPIMRDLATASDPQAAFSAVLNSNRNDTTAMVTALMDRADALPTESRQVVLDGMRTAYIRVLRDRFLGRRLEMGGMRSVLPANIMQAEEEMRPILSVGNVVFRDQPEFMEAVNMMTDLAGLTAGSRNATPVAAMSATEFNRQANTATNRLIYTLIGPLSRTGTRVRALVGGALQALDSEQRATHILDRILADPEYFVELARRYNRQPNDPEAMAALVRGLTTAAVRANDQDAAEVELQMRGAFGQ